MARSCSRTRSNIELSVARCVEINCNALHAIDASWPRECVGSMAWDSLVYLRTAEVTGILKDVFMS